MGKYACGSSPSSSVRGLNHLTYQLSSAIDTAVFSWRRTAKFRSPSRLYWPSLPEKLRKIIRTPSINTVLSFGICVSLNEILEGTESFDCLYGFGFQLFEI